MPLDLNSLLRGVMVRCRMENLYIDFLRLRDAHDRNVLRRRETFAGHFLWFPAPEDLILMKLKVGRARDFDDAIRWQRGISIGSWSATYCGGSGHCHCQAGSPRLEDAKSER